MGSFEQNFNHKPKSPENILNDWDKEYLEKGVIGTMKNMYQDFNNNFPDVIILPERGARPLYYLLDPIFKKLNAEKDTKIPVFIYFSVGKKAGTFMRTSEQYTDIKTSNDLMQDLMDECYPDLSIDEIQRIVDKQDVEGVIEARNNMRERAEEINTKIYGKNFKLAIVDEVLSNGTTVKEVRKAFNNEEIPAYTLVAISSGFDEMTKSGYRFNDEENQDNPNTNSQSFSFEHSEKALGITKSFNQKYTTPIKAENKEEAAALALEKKQLRVEMRDLGEDIANKVVNENLV